MSEVSENIASLVGIEAAHGVFRAVRISPDGNTEQSSASSFSPGGDTLSRLIDFLGGLNRELGDFGRAGIAVPGLLDLDTKRIAFSAHFPEFSQIDIVGEIKSALGLDVVMENDANAAALGEFTFGAGRGCSNLFYATIGAGVGGALILNKAVWRGDSGFAGEFGYFAINSDGMRLEEMASSANIVRRTRDRFHQDNTSSLNDLDEESISISDIVSAAEAEDDFSKLMLERTGIYVGTAVASVINLLNIERIIIGGETVDKKGIILNAIIKRARELSFAPSFKRTQILRGTLGKNAAAIGAALLTQQ